MANLRPGSKPLVGIAAIQAVCVVAVRRRTLSLTLIAVLFAALPTTALAGKGEGCGKGCDKAPPSVWVEDPAAGASLSGTITVTGTAADNKQVSAVAVRVDDGGFFRASGTSSWTTALDSTAFSDGSHTITARATDAWGNTATSSVTVTFTNAGALDVTPPSVSIASPVAGANVSGTITVAGVAADDTQLANIKIRVDGVNAVVATGTTTWTATLDSSAYPDGIHQLAAVATDTAGNAAEVSEAVSFANAAPSASPSPSPEPSPSPSPSPIAPSATHMVTPEGVRIDVDTAGSWTAQQMYDLLKPNALQLGLIGPTLTIKVQDVYGSQVTTAAAKTGGRYTSFSATMYLKGIDSTFSVQPDAQIAHEYGHVWTLYHLYMTQNGDWSSYLNARWSTADGSTVLGGDPRLDSGYSWSRTEIIADDYRLLFGSSLAISERPIHLNRYIPAPTDVPGLRDFLLNRWG